MPGEHSFVGAAGGRGGLQVADVFRDHGELVARRLALTDAQRRVLRDVRRCRTAALGGHVDVCDRCGHSQPSYNSCRNRHCPTCQASQQARWIQQRQARVLPVHHFHVVFTLPAELRRFVPANRRLLYKLLFDASAQTLLTLGEDRLGGQLGVTSVLHTWTRDLQLHPHVHCVVTGGGLTREETPRWIASRPEFLFPLGVLRSVFRGKMLDGLDRACRAGTLRIPPELRSEVGWADLLSRLHRKKWVVYCKRPFGGPRQVFEYLGRYTHRVAISSARLKAVSDEVVVFRTRGDKVARLHPYEFIRRFLLHTLPPRFRKIRHYGLLSPAGVRGRLPIAEALLPAPARDPEHAGAEEADEPDSRAAIEAEARRCPLCADGRLFREAVRRLPTAAARDGPSPTVWDSS